MEYTKDSADLDEDPPPGEPLKVMLADDDKDDQETFGEALRESEIAAELTTVDNGQELLATLKDPSEPNPDIIFLDINMPRMDGFDCLREIKKLDGFEKIPVILYSNGINEEACKRAFSLGAAGCVRKASDIPKLAAIIQRIATKQYSQLFLEI
ncbi:MAG: response regulator [Chitinophagaceae bacterium]